MVIKPKLEFSLLSTIGIAGDYILTLHIKNIGNRILKNLVVQLQSPDPRSSIDCAKCFVYALMPKTDATIKFKVFDSSLAWTCFSVSGYASGDAYFYIESPVMAVQIKDPLENEC